MELKKIIEIIKKDNGPEGMMPEDVYTMLMACNREQMDDAIRWTIQKTKDEIIKDITDEYNRDNSNSS